MKPITVVLADDHPVVRAGIRWLLSSQTDVDLVAEAEQGGDIEPAVERHHPDVLILDLNMPGLNVLEHTRGLIERFPGTSVLVLTFHDEEEYVLGLVRAGVRGYVLKDEALSSLVEAVRAVAGGGTWFSQGVAAKLATSVASGPGSEVSDLTGREREILTLVARGLGNEDIAADLFIARRTVQNHISSIYAKLGLRSRAEAVLFAVRHGLVDPSESDR